MSLFRRIFDERFLDHRRRSTSFAGVAGVLVAGGLFYYRYFFQHVFSWDLFAIVAVMALVKVAVMVWYLLTD